MRVDRQVAGRFIVLIIVEQLDQGDESVILEIHGRGGEGRAGGAGQGGEVHLHSLFGQYSLHDQFRGGVSDGGEYFRFDIAEDFDELDVVQQRMTLSPAKFHQLNYNLCHKSVKI